PRASAGAAEPGPLRDSSAQLQARAGAAAHAAIHRRGELPVTGTFIHLRLHTEYSIVDGLVRIDELVSRTAALGMPAVTITDHVSLFGLIQFSSAATSRGIKPVCGCDILTEPDATPQRPFALTLLARDRSGYRNLTELISRAYTDRLGG